MRWMSILGVILVVAGVASLIFNVIPYHQTEQVAKIGPITATQETEKQFVIPPYVGAIVVAAGVGLVIAARRKA